MAKITHEPSGAELAKPLTTCYPPNLRGEEDGAAEVARVNVRKSHPPCQVQQHGVNRNNRGNTVRAQSGMSAGKQEGGSNPLLLHHAVTGDTRSDPAHLIEAQRRQ